LTPQLILFSFLAYTLLLFAITWFTARKADNQSFYIGNKTSTWYIVAYGMIGASLSGVTFMSVPGWVKDTQFTYLMVVFGYFVGYIIIANVLMPMYYRLNLTSIYTYLEQRFGFWSYKTGSFFFILSRVIGASLRMFLVVNVLQVFIFDAWNISFIFTASMFILLIILYTFKGGIKTIIWTDTLQTTFMLGALVLTIVFILRELNIGFGDMLYKIVEADYSRIVITDWTSKRHFIKQFFSGVFIAIVMTGLDQEMMQKNLSCRNLKDAKKNMLSFSMVLVLVNMLFLFLGAILLIYVKEKGINISDIRTDDLFSTISIKFLGPIAGLVFVLGLISAAYPSADGALTSLTTSFCIDILGLNKNKTLNEKQKTKIRYIVHIGFALLLLIAIVIFRSIFYSIKAEEQAAVVSKIFTVAGYTYGPLLGLYTFGLFTKLKVRDHWVPVISIISPILCYLISENSIYILNGYKFGFELLIVNGLITYFGLWLARKKEFV
jgi:Na+/proline symporter